MTVKKLFIYLVNNPNEINLDYVKKTGAILVLRNVEKIDISILKRNLKQIVIEEN